MRRVRKGRSSPVLVSALRVQSRAGHALGGRCVTFLRGITRSLAQFEPFVNPMTYCSRAKFGRSTSAPRPCSSPWRPGDPGARSHAHSRLAPLARERCGRLPPCYGAYRRNRHDAGLEGCTAPARGRTPFQPGICTNVGPLIQRDHGINLDQRHAQVGLHSRPGGARLGKVGGVDLVHRREVARITQVDLDLDRL